MNALDLNKVLGLVEKAAIKGYMDMADGYQFPDFKPKLKIFTEEIEKKISGSTICPEMAYIKAYNFGINFYLKKIT